MSGNHRPYVAALGAFVLAQVLAGGAAAQGCNSSGSPTPPPATVPSVNGQTFGPPPQPGLVINLAGVNGCPGAEVNGTGGDGSPGQPAASPALDLEGITTIGSSGFALPTGGASLPIIASGGSGGPGGQSDYSSIADTHGGNGGAAGTAGSITGSITGYNFAGDDTTPAAFGLYVEANGGGGGGGGTASHSLYPIQGGAGTAGAAGGTINLSFDGIIYTGNTPSPLTTGAAFLANGGSGGAGGQTLNAVVNQYAGAGANGGAGGSANVTTSSASEFEGTTTGLWVSTEGGAGGAGGGTGTGAPEEHGGAAGAGGAGGTATVSFDGSISVSAAGDEPPVITGLLVQSNGGSGGNGGLAGGTFSQTGGAGGAGGDGGAAGLTLLGDVDADGSDDAASLGGQGVLVQGNGGQGGFGSQTSAFFGFGGNGGAAGSGHQIALQLGTTDEISEAFVTTDGTHVHGVVAQSIGGGGGQGGSAKFASSGGAGANGGNGGGVGVVGGQVWSITSGDSSRALIGQSIGGGGGVGGNSDNVAVLVGYAVGGNGGAGGDASWVNFQLTGNNNIFASTSEKGGGGVLAQSIGGGGGAGGNASSKGVGFFAMTVGGDSGNGGKGNTVEIDSASLVSTNGDHAVGLMGQSIGGGGGVAGVAISTIGSPIPTAAVAVGGRGGSGGPAGTVTINNSGQVNTFGPDAFGIAAQSVGGGGGSGGSATATAIDVSPSDDVPAISISFAAGGAGGSGNTGNTATVTNSGIITTAGHGAMGIKAQSVGGGGGHAGDASAASWTATRSTDANIAIDLSMALGGAGGVGGTGGAVNGSNTGLVYTTGQDAFGFFGHSIGGGGGTGGVGDTSATSVMDDLSVSVSVGVGGTGGTGGHGGDVTLTNGAAGLIGTGGDGADGVFAQSVGGGGGAAGGGTAATSGGELSISMGVGGKGGAGGDGGNVTAVNNGLIVTNGTDSLGLAGQSVGGGGGRGGKAGSTAGGADDDLPLFVGDQIANGFGVPDSVTEVYNDIFLMNDRVSSDITTAEKFRDHFTGNAGEAKENDNISLSVVVGVSMGGTGGAAGHGGDITLTNTGQISTQGAHADAMLGQSVGGGGGMAGGSAASTTASDDTTPSLALSAGGDGGGAGNGGAVTLNHSGLVETAGVGAFGLVGQSIGGGGGRGGASGDDSTSALSFGVSLGGGGGSSGDGGKVQISTCPTSESGCGTPGSVATTGKHAVGILAQSVGGGGGVIRTMPTRHQGDQSAAEDADDPDTHNIFLDVGIFGASGAQGTGGEVDVQVEGGSTISTTGRNAHGVVVSSVGGGGGAVGGGVINVIRRDATVGAATGDAGVAQITVQDSSVSVSGANSVALWASSIGGGGNVLLTDTKAGAAEEGMTGQSGDAAVADIDILGASRISATGGGHAIVAHSIAGGGNSVYDGGGVGPTLTNGKPWESVASGLTYDGNGVAAGVDIGIGGTSSVSASGKNASAIVAAAAQDVDHGNDANGAGNILVRVTSAGATVSNNSFSNATIQMISSLNSSVVANAGTIRNAATGGYALYNGGTGVGYRVANSGTIVGNVGGATTLAGSEPSAIVNRPRGVLAPYDTIDLGAAGTLENAGVVEVSGARRFDRTTLTGDLVQTETGRLRFDLDSAAGKVDHLHVTGDVSLAGGFEVVPTTLMPGSHEVLSVEGGLALDDGLAGAATHLFAFDPSVSGGKLSLSASADFRAAGSDTDDRRALAGHLQEVWEAGGSGFASGFAALAGIERGDRSSYASALDSLAGESVAAIGYARYLGSQSFAQSTYSCPRFEEASVVRTQASCGWLRVRGSWLERDASNDDPGFSFDAVTTAVGGQVQIGDGLFVGGALGWETSQLQDDANRTSVDGDSFLAAVSLKREMGPWTLTGAADLGWGDYDSSRRVTVGTASETAKASPDAFNAGLHFRGAYQIPRGTWYMEPALDVDLAYVRLDGYTESGAGDFNLQVNESDTVVLTGTPWLKLGRRVDLQDGGTLDAYFSAGVSLSTGEDFDTTARFADTPRGVDGFTTTLDNPNVIGRLSAGVEFYATDRVQLRLQYDGSFADGQSDNGGLLRLSYLF